MTSKDRKIVFSLGTTFTEQDILNRLKFSFNSVYAPVSETNVTDFQFTISRKLFPKKFKYLKLTFENIHFLNRFLHPFVKPFWYINDVAQRNFGLPYPALIWQQDSASNHEGRIWDAVISNSNNFLSHFNSQNNVNLIQGLLVPSTKNESVDYSFTSLTPPFYPDHFSNNLAHYFPMPAYPLSLFLGYLTRNSDRMTANANLVFPRSTSFLKQSSIFVKFESPSLQTNQISFDATNQIQFSNGFYLNIEFSNPEYNYFTNQLRIPKEIYLNESADDYIIHIQFLESLTRFDSFWLTWFLIFLEFDVVAIQ